MNGKISELESELKLKEQAVKEANEKVETEKQLAVANTQVDFNRQITEYKDKIQLLESRKNRMSIKDIGEDLENFMQTEYSNNGSWLEFGRWEKVNETIDGKKPDFKFSIFDVDDSVISSVILEAKSEQLNSANKTKNSQHFEKLDADRKRNNAEYAILVSELEKEEDQFIFKKVNDFEKMFIVRPQYFIALLSLIYNLEIKKRGLQNLEIAFREKQEILAEFESMKNEIINQTIPHIQKKIEAIIKKAEQIEDLSQAIVSEARAALGKNNLSTLTNKIEDFKIRKLLNRIDAINL